jgi:nitrous oxidase accessory protein
LARFLSRRLAVRPIVRLLAALAAVLLFPAAWAYPPLQLFVDLTPEHGLLRPPPGTYSGPVVVTRPIALDGQGKVTLDGGGEGTVLTVRADGVTVKGLRIIGSGSTYDGVDAGLLVEAEGVLVEDNVVEDTLFGIHLRKADGNTLRGNHISSRGLDPNLRGDAIRLWYSHDNLIEANEIHDSRDLVFANANDNRILHNEIRDSRVGMQFVFAHGNRVEGNRLTANATGIMALYSNDLTIRGNRLWNARHHSGAALTVKESSGVVIEDNEVVHCAVAVQANSPTHPESVLKLTGNRFAYNDVAMYFYGEKGGHAIHGNRFEKNFVDIAVSHPNAARGNDWRDNYWDEYAGFDRDGDGVGDVPHEVYAYADRLWMDRPLARFFRGSLALEMIDFLERLAPFSQPEPLLSDPAPRMR